MGENNAEIENKDRKEFYTEKAKEAAKSVPKTFVEFVHDKEIIEVGDDLIERGLSTGYNIGTSDKFPLTSVRPRLLHNNYIQRSEHFGDLLSKMETENIISEDSFAFGVKASKVIGYWGDPEVIKGEIVRRGERLPTSESVEQIVIFTPEDIIQAIKIANFLQTRAILGVPYEIEKSWEIVDVRATENKQITKALLELEFSRWPLSNPYPVA